MAAGSCPRMSTTKETIALTDPDLAQQFEPGSLPLVMLDETIFANRS
jgi:hypothetical protein